MNSEDKIETQPDEINLDIPPEFRPVCEKYGRPMFALVMAAGLSSQATQVLANLAGKHHSRGGLHAVGVLSQSFNEVSTAYCKLMGWDEGILAQCDRDIGLAFQGKVQAPGQSIILDS